MALCGDQEALHGLADKDATPVVQTDHLVRGELHTMPCSPPDRLTSHTASDGVNEPQTTYTIHTIDTADTDCGIDIGGYNPVIPNNAPGSIDIRHTIETADTDRGIDIGVYNPAIPNNAHDAPGSINIRHTIETGDTDYGIVLGRYNTHIHVQKNIPENVKAGNMQTIATVDTEPCIDSDNINEHQTDDKCNIPNSIDNALASSRPTRTIDISDTSSLTTMDDDSNLMEENESMPQRPMTYDTPLEIDTDYGDDVTSVHPGLEMECESHDMEEEDDQWDDSQPSHVVPTVCGVLDHSYGVLAEYGDDRVLQCHHCGLVFMKPHRLTTHLRKHFRDNDFHCDRCCESPANNTRPGVDKRLDDDGRALCSQCGKVIVAVPSKHICKRCGLTYTPCYRVRKHKCPMASVCKHRRKLKAVREAIRMGKHNCKVCEKQFTKATSLAAHICRPEAMRIVEYKCEMCGKQFTKENSLKGHSRIHKHSSECECPFCRPKARRIRRSVGYKCEVCGKPFTNANSLKVHSRIHTDKDHRKCHVCGTVLRHPSALRTHMRIHSDRKRDTICKVCNKGFPDKNGLKHHMVFHEEKKFSCTDCGKKFHIKGTLARHIQSHSGVKSHQCEKCGSRFTRVDSLKTHMMVVHEKVKNFICEYCEKAFSTKEQMIQHTRGHTGERPFICTQCGKTFRQKSILKTHVRIHTGERPFPCTQCGKTFRIKQSLDIHLRIHTGEHPYNCTHCDKVFIQQSALDTHVRIHTGERPFKCPQCSKTFTQKSSLNTHVRMHT